MLTRRLRWITHHFMCVLSFWGVVAADWDKEQKLLFETKSKWKRTLTRIQTYFTLVISTAFVLGLGLDLYNQRIDESQAVVIGLMAVTGGMAGGIAAISFHTGVTIIVINNILKLDRILKDMMLTRREVIQFESGGSRTFNLLLWMIPTSCVWMLGAGLLFFEEYDPFRRYIFVHFRTILGWFGLSGWYVDGLGVLIYMGAAGVAVGDIGLCILIMSLFVEVISFWLTVLIDPTIGKKKSKSLSNLVFVFRVESILFDIGRQIPITVITAICSFFPTTFAIYASIILFGVLNWGTYAIMPTTVFVSFALFHYFCLHMEHVYKMSETFVRDASVRSIGHRWFGKFLKSCRLFDYSVIGFFSIRASLFPTFCAQCMDKAIMLLLS